MSLFVDFNKAQMVETEREGMGGMSPNERNDKLDPSDTDMSKTVLRSSRVWVNQGPVLQSISGSV